jgi:hypothetical protein
MLPQLRVCKHIPVQDNHCDCGLFVLTYLEYFVAGLPPALSKQAVEAAWRVKAGEQGEWGVGGLEEGAATKRGACAGHGKGGGRCPVHSVMRQ